MSSLGFSLIVPTINRTEELVELFESLVKQSYKKFDVIVVDQNSDDRVKNIIKKFSSQLKITHIETVQCGASKARNIGIERAQGGIITFPDDDCEYPTELLEKVNKILDKEIKYDGISLSSKDKSRIRGIARFDRKRKDIYKFNILKCCIEFGIFIRRESLGNIRFDERLGVGASTPWWSDEGPDLLLRLINENRKFLYIPELTIYHPNPVWRYDKNTAIRSRRYGCGRGQYLRKHKYPLWYVVYVWNLYVVGIVIGIVQFKPGKIRYYFKGLEGRILGYFSRC